MLKIILNTLFLCCFCIVSGLHLRIAAKHRYKSIGEVMGRYRLTAYNEFSTQLRSVSNPHYSRNPYAVLKPWSSLMKFIGGETREMKTTTKTIALNSMNANWDSFIQASQQNISPSVAQQKQAHLSKIGFILVVASIVYSIFSNSGDKPMKDQVTVSGFSDHTDTSIQNRKTMADFTQPEAAACWRSTTTVKRFSRPVASARAQTENKHIHNVVSSAAADCAVQVKSNNADSQQTTTHTDRSSPGVGAAVNHMNPADTIASRDSVRPSNAGFLSSFFKNPAGSGRPADLHRALHPTSSSSSSSKDQLFRAATARSLLNSMPEGTFTQSVISEVLSPEAQVLARDSLQSACAQTGLSSADAAEIFAEVTHALLASLVDAAATSMTTSKHSDPSSSVRALHSLTDFIAQAHRIFDSLFPDTVVEPIQYNGKAQPKQLEELYYRYLKASQTVDVPLGGTVTAASTAAAHSREHWEERLAQLQFLFNLKDSRVAAVAQRVQREALLEGLGDQGGQAGAGDLGELLDTMRAPHSAVAPPGRADSTAAGFEGMMSRLPDFSKMSQEEMVAASREAMSQVGLYYLIFRVKLFLLVDYAYYEQVKTMIQEGRMTHSNVQLFEKNTGMKVGDMLRAVDAMQRQGGEAALQRLGPDLIDMIDIFRQLRDVK